LSGQQVVLLMNADFGPYIRNTQHFLSADIGRLNLHIKRSTQSDTVGKISDTQVTQCRSNDHLMHLIQENAVDLHGEGRDP
jgi:hypothetical protein